MLIIRCSKHKKYRAARKRKASCIACEVLYYLRNPPVAEQNGTETHPPTQLEIIEEKEFLFHPGSGGRK